MNNRLFIFAPFFILVYFFVHFTIDYFYFLKPISVAITFIKYALAIGFIYFVGYKIFKKKEKFILAFSTILFIFLFFGSFTDTAIKYKIFNAWSGFYFKLAIIFLLVIVTVLFLVRLFSIAITRKLLLFWLIYCAALIIYDWATFILSAKREKIYLTHNADFTLNINTTKPSVFYLLFDMYPSDTVFHRYFNYDNSALSAFLQQKDFFVTGNAHSLYDETYYSLSSILNLEPLSFYADTKIENYKKVLLSLKNTEHSSLLSAFEKAGYSFRNFSVFDLQDQRSPLQFNLNHHIDNILTSTTFFNRIYNGADPDFLLAEKNIDLRFLKSSWSDNVKKDVATLEIDFKQLLDSISKNNKPSFNYFHFMIPHPPLLYDSNGHENKIRDMYFFDGYDKGIEKYISYTKYGNKKIKEMVNKIFEKGGKNVVIIIQGDHGFREFADRLPNEARLGILNAIYLPNKNYSNFNDTMTPVFTFKQILNNQFGTFLK